MSRASFSMTICMYFFTVHKHEHFQFQQRSNTPVTAYSYSFVLYWSKTLCPFWGKTDYYIDYSITLQPAVESQYIHLVPIKRLLRGWAPSFIRMKRVVLEWNLVVPLILTHTPAESLLTYVV